MRYASGGRFSLQPIEVGLGFISFHVEGATAQRDFANEAGGHRWQRIPPGEKRGRVHTSTVTVAVLPEPTSTELDIQARDIELKTARGSGPGGQARNKTESCVIATHRPTGTVVRCDSSRSQSYNRETALRLLRARLFELQRAGAKLDEDASRRRQVGTGQRGDNVRTVRTQDGVVTDHRTGAKISLGEYEQGNFDRLSR
jgi:peptide chain release factor 1